MFATKTHKSNSLAYNTQKQFKAELSNHSFETAAGLLRKTGNQLKQTKLSHCQKDNRLIFSGFVEEPQIIKPKHEFVYMPRPNRLNKSFCRAQNDTEKSKIVPVETSKIEPRTALPTTPMSKPGRNLISLIGRVDFCIKMHKKQPDLNAIWNVYGKLLRIIVGNRGQHTLLLRTDEHGPILQSIFYDFENELRYLTNGCYLLVVGRFTGENRLTTFNVTQVSRADWQQDFSRLENVTSYILMQNTFNN